MGQNNILENLNQDQKKIWKKRDTYESACALYEGPEITFNVFKSGVFPINAIQNRMKILTPK